MSARAAKRRMLRAAGERRAKGKKGRRAAIRGPVTAPESFPELGRRGFSVARTRDLLEIPPEMRR